MAYQRKNKKLGELLLDAGVITPAQLQAALDEHDLKGIRLGEAFISLGYVTNQVIRDTLCSQLDIEFVELRKLEIDTNIAHLVNASVSRKYTLLPFSYNAKQPNVLNVAMDNPMDILAIDDVSILTNMTIQPFLADTDDINAAIEKFFGKEQADEAAKQFEREQLSYEEAENADDAARREGVENSPIVKVVRGIIESAVRQRASDIHIEPFENVVRLRYRIDGVLFEQEDYAKSMYSAIIARLKIMSGMDISEKRKPQDGRITITVDRKEYDIRVSNLPTVFGEKVVMRLASKEGFKKDKKDLGMNEIDLQRFTDILRNPHGIILVTGPTGSGKSTTLYTALSELSTSEVNIITVEDPVEANVDGVNQVQVNVKADLTFASALRSILRQDPDIIMIGEIRDGETAEIAVKASITGHLVVSTLHTNSTAASVSRLVDMGVEPYLLGDSLVGIIAQRLVRRLCECKTVHIPTDKEREILGLSATDDTRIYEPKGCKLCNDSGYHGRIGVYEIMPITRKLRGMIADRCNADELTAQAQSEGMNTLRQAASKYVLEGITSFEEMMKITYEAEE